MEAHKEVDTSGRVFVSSFYQWHGLLYCSICGDGGDDGDDNVD